MSSLSLLKEGRFATKRPPLSPGAGLGELLRAIPSLRAACSLRHAGYLSDALVAS